ncbi:hypothetical protein GCM10010896_01830 [Mammaliicoccus stepanovicii]|uniref:Preprotein translocase subunit SecB n=2 Tax=Mammaliicoccus stepanovicii TaxID=643214 RepID=A0A239ZX72_9STAP|nr:hypothetical protein [Mammaliicoccus stepanovicii]GGI39127.1 hypothetical protein GCM10010896_01830 [Mammaliicoccus stepanovicii]SNV75404.1 Uncharacterised protein [Mammaliicoccus stepanovicii]
MKDNYHIQLNNFELQAMNFMKKKKYNNEISKLEPNYKVLIKKGDGSIKEGILVVTLENDFFDMKVIVKGQFENINGENIENETLSKLIVPLLLPLTRPIIHNQLIQSGINDLLLPTIDIQRYINSND